MALRQGDGVDGMGKHIIQHQRLKGFRQFSHRLQDSPGNGEADGHGEEKPGNQHSQEQKCRRGQGPGYDAVRFEDVYLPSYSFHSLTMQCILPSVLIPDMNRPACRNILFFRQYCG